LELSTCDQPPDPSLQFFDAEGKNGWVYFRHVTGKCLFPMDTGVVKPFYPLGLMDCPRSPNHSVPNIVAWRYTRIG
jgi:hypothetical protein